MPQSNHPQYVEDCQRLYKFIFPHDDSVNDRVEGGQLDLAWQTTVVRFRVSAPPLIETRPLCPIRGLGGFACRPHRNTGC